MALDVTKTLKRYEGLLNQRRLWEDTWDRIAALVLPRKSGLMFKRTPGTRVEQQFTSVGMRACELLAATMNGSLTSGAVQWFRLRLRDPMLNMDPEVAMWLDEFSRRLFRAFQQSNFTAEMPEVYADLGAFGTGCLFMDERRGKGYFGGFRFQSQEIGTYVIAEDDEGTVNTIFRMLMLSPRAAYGRWGKKIGEKLMLKLEKSEQADTPVQILHGVYPRADYKYEKAQRATQLPFASCYIDYEGRHLIDESGYHEMRFLVPRWSKVSGETWGRGPGFTALADLRTLNKAVELNLQAWAKAIKPPLMVRHDGVVGTVRTTPDALITVYDMEAVAPLETKARFDVTVIEREALENSIRDTFFWQQLQLPNQQIYTATEVERRLELMQRVLGPTLGRLDSELLQPLITNGAALLLRAGARSQFQDPSGAPMPPQVIAELLARGEAEVDIEYEGPLARAQKAQDTQQLAQTLQLAMPIAQLDPDSMVVYNFEEWHRFLAERRGVPPQLMRGSDEVEQIKQEKAQARNQMAQQQAAGEMASSLGAAAPMVKALMPSGLEGGGEEAAPQGEY